MKNRYFRPFIIVLFLILLSLSLSVNGFCRTHSKEGTVTKAPWKEKYQHIEIDELKYTFMPDATLFKLEHSGNEIYNQSPIRFYHIYSGQRVSVQVQGHRIYQLIILP